ncbi:site-specific DNA-methyltransferase [Roseobacter litoralis]|uniref:Methyltransferase n=1 Tax=Roseobacter litoralis (strain ATCC 49566 / DSM 6996 / JCM 21268 / NBRC 15278 / OCh 149) TaxID=391595 RepID=F7ZG52_ROSLO|nr:DNA methyltransferase [Roseobacter litoralis]AEI94783.1 putative adenine methyltransferase [Roseobacter litoralis Och 149]
MTRQETFTLPDPGDMTMRPVGDLNPYANNPRTHSKKQIRQIADSIREFGWTNPVLIDAGGGVIAGHGRIAAAKLLGITDVPVLRLEHMSEAQKRAYIITDNKLAENAGWDSDLLKIELQGLLDLSIDFDIELTGFETGEIDVLLAPETAPEPEPVPLPETDRPPVSRPGDLWLIGKHRLLCGDALNPADWRALMDQDKAQMIFVDPPYNVPIAGHVSGLGAVKHREFAMASGEMSQDAFTDFLRGSFRNLAAFSADGSVHFVCMDWRHMREVLDAAEGIYPELKNLCIWAKTNAGMGSFYRSQHELVFAFKSGTAPHINNFGLGDKGRHRSNLWTYAGANTFRAGRMDDLKAHPTVKPVDMVADAILDCSERGGIVADAFAGSGTTLLAAAKTGRIGVGMEIDPHYADLIVRRLQDATGETAVHAESFESFAALSTGRGEDT